MIAASPCPNCEHYDGERSCTAYPAGIPQEILRMGAEHDVPRGDEEAPGVVFVLNPARRSQDEARRKLVGMMS